MTPSLVHEPRAVAAPELHEPSERLPWVDNANLLWTFRRRLARTTAVAFAIGLVIAFTMPKEYDSFASIMPPEQSGTGASVLAALAGKSSGGLGALGGLAGSLLGGRNSSALFVDLLRSGTVTGHIIDRFNLQQIYKKRYRIDTAKYLLRHTTVVEDKKSGIITIKVQDTDPVRARDIAAAYLQELNQLVTQTNTSSAHQERIFVERRLLAVQSDLEQAQLQLSEFSSTHATIDIKEQTRAMVDAAAKLQGQLIVGESELGSLQQIYGEGNVRVRAAQVRVSALKHELSKMSGTSAALPAEGDTSPAATEAAATNKNELYPPLRQLPRLAVPYADLYRRVRVQETVFELLTQEYEMSRIQEAKDVPVISIIDLPGIAEKKSFPPRLIVALLISLFAALAASALILVRNRWDRTSNSDPRKLFLQTIFASLRSHSFRSPR